jgi:choline dehydrogenase-like flavoprotein
MKSGMSGRPKARHGRTQCETPRAARPSRGGLLGTTPSYNLMMKCDSFLMVGSGFPYSEFLPEEGADLFETTGTAHPMGGCPMGASPEDGVVDGGGCAWDSDNL